MAQPRLERIDRLVRFVRTLNELLELPGKGKPVAALRQTIHAETRIERQIGSPFVTVEKCLRLRNTNTEQGGLPDYNSTLAIGRHLGSRYR